MQEKKNIINIDEIKNILTDIKIQSEIIDSSLKNIEEIINESIGINGKAWSGESANEFINSWNKISNNTNDFKLIVQNQINNINSVLVAMKDQ
jgi:uncharacterized protein YukE